MFNTLKDLLIPKPPYPIIRVWWCKTDPIQQFLLKPGGGVALSLIVVYTGAPVQVRWVIGKGIKEKLYAIASDGQTVLVHLLLVQDCSLNRVQKLRESGATGMLDQTAVPLYDGYCSNISLRILEETANNKVMLCMKLSRHATEKFEPLDVTVFGSLKLQTCELWKI